MNKAFLNIILFCLTATFSFAQKDGLNQTDKNGLKQGHWIKKDAHDRPIYEGFFKNGKPYGEFKYYYDSGELQSISVFYNNGSECRSKFYFPGNILMAEGNYVNEKRDSIWNFYEAKDALVSVESYKDGKKEGVEKNYNGKGKLLEEKNWKDSVLHGPWIKYYEDGSIQQKGTYNTGFWEGDMKFYYPGNVPSVFGQYEHSLKIGKWTYYDRAGKNIISVENYYLGDLNGDYTEWNEKNHALKVKGSYKRGKKDGKWNYFDEEGKPTADTTFLIGYLLGTCTEYYENGSKKSESNYYYSHKTGTWTEWDETGKVTNTETYDSINDVKTKMAQEEKERKKKLEEPKDANQR